VLSAQEFAALTQSQAIASKRISVEGFPLFCKLSSARDESRVLAVIYADADCERMPVIGENIVFRQILSLHGKDSCNYIFINKTNTFENEDIQMMADNY
jgi:hypothetical protein